MDERREERISRKVKRKTSQRRGGGGIVEGFEGQNKGGVGGDGEEQKGKEEIEKGEIRRVMRCLKEGKAAGGDGIPGEVWKYGGRVVEEWISEICNRIIWGGEG